MRKKSQGEILYENLQLVIGAALAVTVSFFVNALGLQGVIAIWLLVALIVFVVYVARRRSARLVDVRQAPATKGALADLEAGETGSPVCDPGPYQVEGGEFLAIPLDVGKGNHVHGRVEEVEGDDFDWFIVDEANLVAFRNGQTYDFIDGGDHVAASIVDAYLDTPGPWFLILSNERRQIDRIIEVHLRRN
ncbi:MAG: hypothetical protein ACE5IJ_01695 [Thermoplasmata archaeon]